MYEFGSGILTGLRNDANVSGTQTPRRFGTLQDVQIDFSGDIKELFGSYQYPVDVARGKTKIQGKAKFATIQASAYNDLYFGQTLTTGQLKFAFNEVAVVPSTPYQYTVANSGDNPYTDQGVFYQSTGIQLTAVASGPTTGQYAFNTSTGVYTFAAGDSGVTMLVNYLYTVSTGFNIALNNLLMGTTPQFQATLMQQFEANQIVLVLFKCVASKLSYPTKLDDYVLVDFEFQAFANAAGSVGSLNVAS